MRNRSLYTRLAEGKRVAMRCPKCGCLEDKVIETRVSKEGDTIRRRRVCSSCAHRFTTREAPVPAEITVVKRDGTREEFDADKLRSGIRHATWKRGVTYDQIDDIVTEITAKLIDLQEREVSSHVIGEFAMEALQTLDEVAYVRFASVYRQFRSVDQFINEVQNLSAKTGAESAGDDTGVARKEPGAGPADDDQAVL